MILAECNKRSGIYCEPLLVLLRHYLIDFSGKDPLQVNTVKRT